MKRIKGLDTLRFVLALWVVIGHFGVVPLPVSKETMYGQLAVALYHNMISGPAAVIVFFVISGFCIYYPYRNSDSILLGPYYTRRYIRILTPMVFALAAAKLLSLGVAAFNDSVLWSLLCEEIYYLIFPALLLLQRRIGWTPILIVSAVASVLVMLQAPTEGDYPSHGAALNWLLGLPCWLLGCVLAQKLDAVLSLQISAPVIWAWRFVAWGLSVVCSVLRFHTPVGYQWTLNLFAVFVFFWLQREIAYAESHNPNRITEWAGKWSYSLYLFHMPVLAILWHLEFNAGWTGGMLFTLAACYLFYLAVERPAHLFAKSLGRKLSRKLQAPEPLTAAAGQTL